MKLDISPILDSELGSIREKIKVFTNNEEYNFISLGQNCNSAYYLKQAGLKNASFPFDWIFSSADIVDDCLKNNFIDFLDKKYIFSINEKKAGHKKYHNILFNHRNPLASSGDYEYYKRCVSRFKKIINSDEKILFICTLLNEPSKRIGWSSGFIYDKLPPINQTVETYKNVIQYFKSLPCHVKFVFIDQYTEGHRKIEIKSINEEVLDIRYTSEGKNNGLHYLDKADDTMMKSIYSYFIST